jgi:transposase
VKLKEKSSKMAFIRKKRKGNRVYLVEVENYRVDGKVKQKHLRYLGVDEELSCPNFSVNPNLLTVSDVKIYGPIVVLEHIAKELGLYDLLGDMANPIMALVYAHCLNYKSVREVANWLQKVELPECHEITSKVLYNAIEKLSKVNSEWLQESIFGNMTELLGPDESGVIYDVTNTYLAGNRSSIAKKGRDKEGVRGRKLIQIGLGVTRTYGFPIFHHVRPGNIHDINLFKEAIYHFNTLGTKKGIMVFDRGLTSKECISRLSSTGWKSLAGVKNYKKIKSLISKMDFDDMKNFRNLIIQGETEFFAESFKFEIGGIFGKLIILLNAKKQEYLGRKRRLEILAAKEQLLKDPSKIIESSIIKFFKKNLEINHHAVKRAEKYEGLSFIFTDARLKNEEAIRMYFAKDLIERCFKLEKSILKINPIRMWLDKNIKSHTLICYLGLVLLTTVRCRLLKKGFSMDPDTVLRKLDTIYKVYFSAVDKRTKKPIFFDRVNTMSKRQKELIQAIAPKLEIA